MQMQLAVRCRDESSTWQVLLACFHRSAVTAMYSMRPVPSVVGDHSHSLHVTTKMFLSACHGMHAARRMHRGKHSCLHIHSFTMDAHNADQDALINAVPESINLTHPVAEISHHC